MKTLPETEFGRPQTIAVVPIVDPSAFYEVEVFDDTSFSEFSHNLGQEQSLAKRKLLVSGRLLMIKAAICRLLPDGDNRPRPCENTF
jgi:hypothetical protein